MPQSPSRDFRSIFLATAGAHAADQMALAALPLTAALSLGAGAASVGTLVAAQGAAWLLGSLPAGLLVDRLPRRGLLATSQVLAALGLFASAFASIAGAAPVLGLAAFCAALGTVGFVLTVNSLIAERIPRERLAAANARNELARALVSLAAPVIVGQIVSHQGAAPAYVLAGLMALASAGFALRLPASAPVPRPRRSIRSEIAEGARFVLGDPMLRGIALCAVFWNAAFFALIAVFVSFAMQRVTADARLIGLTQAGYGAGMVLAALAAPVIFRTVSPRVVLVFGPAVSVAAPLLFLLARGGSGAPLLFAGQFLIGFGPMLWLICQTSIRQLVTPPALLGRVGATIQLAIYGVRPLGALLGGSVAAWQGTGAALLMAAALFLLSLLAVLLSRLVRIVDLGALAAPPLPAG